MMYVTPVQPDPYPQVTDEDLERFDWYVLVEVIGHITIRVLTRLKPG